MRRFASTARLLVCVAVVCAGCASEPREPVPPAASEPPATAAEGPEDAAQPGDESDPSSETPPAATSPRPGQEAAAVDEASEPERAETATPSAPDASAPSDSSGPALEQDEPPAEASVLPPIDRSDGVVRWTVEIIESFPHDPEAFTQGLEAADGTMYESTGLRGRSSLRAVDPATGEVFTQVALSDDLFGEGLTVVGEEIAQLTWQSGTAIVYDRGTLRPVGEHRYEGEGWGLCLSDDVLIMSDGSNRLARRDPETFELLGTVTVTATGYDGRLDYLNELECVEGLVIANVWQTDRLLVIDPQSGQVLAAIDAGPLIDDVSQSSPASEIDVLNGVALDPDTATLWMTGKLWPRLYRVRVVEVQ